MKKKRSFKDYAHYYPRVSFQDGKAILRTLESLTIAELKELATFGHPVLQQKLLTLDITKGRTGLWTVTATYMLNNEHCTYTRAFSLKQFTPEQTHYLLGLYVDLFGLIQVGVAVDRATLSAKKFVLA